MPTPYCGKKVTPAGKVKGTANQCFKVGLKAGFVGGLSKNFITKKEVQANGENMGQRALQAIAKLLAIPKYGEKKAIILPKILARDWVRLNAKNVLLAL